MYVIPWGHWGACRAGRHPGYPHRACNLLPTKSMCHALPSPTGYGFLAMDRPPESSPGQPPESFECPYQFGLVTVGPGPTVRARRSASRHLISAAIATLAVRPPPARA